jgi:hypothetical protein
MKDQPTPYESTGPLYRWVRLAKHCEITGDTSDAVHARRRKRVWTDGVQCKVADDGNLYINPEEWNRWIERQASESLGRAA